MSPTLSPSIDGDLLPRQARAQHAQVAAEPLIQHGHDQPRLDRRFEVIADCQRVFALVKDRGYGRTLPGAVLRPQVAQVEADGHLERCAFQQAAAREESLPGLVGLGVVGESHELVGVWLRRLR
jgi:hypothetical protein